MMEKTWLIFTLFCLGGICYAQDSTWNLVWSDEFNRRTLDTAKWNYDLGTGDNGWGNGELQNYTKDNISFNDTCLIIELRKQALGGMEYTSSRINTRKKAELQYGRIQVRLKAPFSQGVWPAVWTLGADYNPPAVPWPDCGEIDIFEMACGENYPDDRGDNANFAVVHYTDLADFPGQQIKGVFVSGRMADKFHIFTLEWDEKFLSFYFDSAATPYLQVDITKAYMSEFHQPHSLVINMALGGFGFALFPDATTVLPQHLTVDWIRWYQKKTAIQNGNAARIAASKHFIKKTGGGLSYTVLAPSRSLLRIFDMSGRQITDLSSMVRSQAAGSHVAGWDCIPAHGGAYVAVFSDGVHGITSDVIIIK
jgi:beta-glucanase (GH16 family)